MGMEIQTSEEQFNKAFGALVTQYLFPHEWKTDMVALRDRADAARLIANAVVYLGSANYDNRPVVVACASILEKLNYIELAQRLKEDRADLQYVTLAEKPGYFLVATRKKNVQFIRSTNRIPGSFDWREKGKVVGRLVPDSERDYQDAITGYFYPNGYLNDNGTVVKIDPVTWDTVDHFRQTRKPAWMTRNNPPAPVAAPTPAPAPVAAPATVDYKTVYIEEKGTLFGVKTPFNRTFVNEIKLIRSKKPMFDNANKFFCWSVALADKPLVMALIIKHFPNNTLVVGLPSY